MKFIIKIFLAFLYVNISSVFSKNLKEKAEKKVSRQLPPSLKEFKITETDNNSIINVVKNVTFNLNLQANPSTGYGLYLKNFDSLDKNSIIFHNILFDNTTKLYMSNVFIPEKNNGTIIPVGAPGHYQFQLTTIGNFTNADLEFVKVKQREPKNFISLTKIKLTSSKFGKFSMKLSLSASINKMNSIYFLFLILWVFIL